MDITWLGHSCFRIKGKDVTLITDPFSPTPTASLDLKLTAHIVTVSHNAPDHDNTTAIGGSPRLLTGPGEYEISGVLITGLPSYHDADQGKQRGCNTIFLIQMDEVIICHLGGLGHPLTAEQQEQITDVDVLLVPVGGHNTITATQAVEVINQIEPRLVIPMHYATSAWQHLDPLEKFSHEMGLKEIEPQQSVKVTKTTLPAERQVILLNPISAK